MRKIPKTMASQHPDNARVPEWVKGDLIAAGDDEIHEAYLAYSQYGCKEVMWDSEGKDVDPHVVRKLLSSYPEYFRERKLGSDIFLTLRIPNPTVETAERKLFLETLETIPRHNDVAATFYNDDDYVAVFEVILPFTANHVEMIRVREAYRAVTTGSLSMPIDYSGFLLRDWVGRAVPEEIEVIPLFEDMGSISRTAEILARYIELVAPPYLRVFVARSDPSMSYGNVVATLLAKWAIYSCKKLEEEVGIPIYPIIGAGCLPFRGHNSPTNVENFLDEYRGVNTVTIQSSYRYDYPLEVVRTSIKTLNSLLPYGAPNELDRELLSILEKLASHYQKVVISSLDAVRILTSYVPSRRSRKLHVGPFGYARFLGGKPMPRTIPFCAAFYSLGIPPEFIGLNALEYLNDEELALVLKGYKHLKEDLTEAGRRLSWENVQLMMERGENVRNLFGPTFLDDFLPNYLKDLKTAETLLGVTIGPKSLSDRRYLNVIENVLLSILDGDHNSLREEIVKAAVLRRSIG